MLINSIRRDVDEKTSSTLMVEIVMRQVLIVYTAATTLPPRSDQADPASTAEIEESGVRQPLAATPSPGGSVPPTAF
jgi:hypothetical protein